MKTISIPGYQRFHAGVVIRAIDKALQTETDKIARYHLKHSRTYLCEFEKRHPAGVIPRQMSKDEFTFAFVVLKILKMLGVRPPPECAN